MQKNKTTHKKYFATVGEHHEKIQQFFLDKGFLLNEDKPEFVVSYGGDGTLLRSEALYPSVPKLFIKNTKIGKLAQKRENDEIISGFMAGDYRIKKVKKIEALINGKHKIIGATEVTLHNADPKTAVRYTVKIDHEQIHHELIGDGVIVCNSLGSTGYYRSITDSYFEVGIGLAFNNSTEQSDHIVLRNDRRICITINRGPAILFADNQDETVELHKDDVIEFYESHKDFNIIEIH
ncbi:MAG: hypothetical protein M0P64_01480 [Candidatus Pacebacteria bacterium]|jgi:NAD+ kinase|nr:hypothetical protein [Candidatus Paceibacterota bacterium]